MKDFDFIKNKFDNDNISAPNSLSEDVIASKLEAGDEPKNVIKLRNKKPFRSAIAIAACFAVLIVSVFSVNALNNKPNVTKNNDSALITYSNYAEIEKQIKSLEKDRVSLFNYGLTMKGDSVDMDIMEETSDSLSLESSGSHSETNIQVEGVDEADIVKTDGEYIYRLNTDYTAIKIYKVDGLDVEKVAFAKPNDNHEYMYVSEMYLAKNKLIAIGDYDDYDENEMSHDSGTFVTVFNIDDKSKPTVEYTYEQSGSYSSSRMIGDVVYLVTNYYVNEGAYIPKTNGKEIPCDCIYGCPNIDEPRFVVIGAVDVVKQDANKLKSKAILGGSSEIYCSNDNLYVASTNYRWFGYLTDDEQVKTKLTSDIIKVSLDKTKLDIVATAQIEGRINNQYSMNEKEGYFFVAVTTENEKHDDINTLYVLDDKLANVSKVNSFAKDESIKAVRYIGNYAYVITYEETDPLFVIDLSNVKNPQIKGSVKIDGFSTSLMPVDENTLLGVGMNVDDLVEDGIKFALFDISNPEEPKVKSELSYEGYYSNAQYEIKAITMFDNKVAIPLYGNDENEAILLVDIKDGKLVESKKYSFGKYSNVLRVVRIGNYLYGITDNASGVGVRAVKM